ncbi:Kinesin heavy chain [Fasciolopsis buskii]|uniref:Kinesin-like protein n=1 Tax=Fasciolopsis buskii TaxID=27845 RepID=A0A8E0RJL2_9TREM|nr:Kinesin heavy chain [Fasciolopsis buski]
MDDNLEFLIKVSYFELYMEKIKDLLDISKTNLPIHETKDRMAFVKGVTERFVSCADDVLDILDEGKMNRHVSVTNMNEHSSRSHSVFRICIQQNNRETGKQLVGSLYLVDLAGSEKVSKSGAEGSTLDEAKNINKSLSTLGTVINALVEGNTHIPYRDSKLTRILQQSLGGNSKTTIIIAASPSTLNETETKSTMIFGVRAKTIKNQVTPNAQLTAEEWRRLYERESDRTKQLFSALTGLDGEVKRWRGGEKPTKEQWYTEEQYASLLRELGDTSDVMGGILSTELSLRVNNSTLSETSYNTCLPPSLAEMAKQTVHSQPSLPMQRTRLIQNAEMSDEERFIELFRLLDEKDDEINKLSQIVTKLEHQLGQIREDYTKTQRDNDKLQISLERAQHEADVSRSEVKDVLQALEELAVTYEEKNNESKVLAKELEDLNGRLAGLQEKAEYHESEAAEIKERMTAMREKLHELIYDLNVQMANVGSEINKMLMNTQPDKNAPLEEQVALLKLYTLQLKSELESVTQSKPTVSVGSEMQTSQVKNVSENNEIMSREYDRKMRELNALLAECERQKTERESQISHLENELASVSEELLQSRTTRQIKVELKDVNEMDENLMTRLQSVIERNASHLQDQINRARGDTERAITASNKLRDENIVLKLQLERYVNEAEVLRRRLDTTESCRADASVTPASKDQAKNEIKTMEESVLRELQVLNSLRRVFITDLKNRVQKNTNNPKNFLEDEPFEPQAIGTALQRERIAFLRNSLDNLTRVHKQLVRDNADLRCDIPKLEKRVKASMERIRDLEHALREAKEQMIKDKRRFHYEIERIKEVNWIRGNTRLRTNIGMWLSGTPMPNFFVPSGSSQKAFSLVNHFTLLWRNAD